MIDFYNDFKKVRQLNLTSHYILQSANFFKATKIFEQVEVPFFSTINWCAGKSFRIPLSDGKLCQQNSMTAKHNCR